MKLVLDWQVRPLFDVVVRIPGRDLPDERVMRGNHHDAWVNGAEDPLSGAMMEEAHAFSELLKDGWRRRRTIIISGAKETFVRASYHNALSHRPKATGL